MRVARFVVAVTAALLCCFAVAPTATADSGADEAELRFERGNTAFRERRYLDALADYFESNRLAPNRNVIFNIAKAYEALGRLEEAYRYYAEYLTLETDGAERAGAEARLAALAPKVALVRVESDPAGATVYLDRRDLGGRGETPLVLAAPPGAHTILLERPGYAAVEVAVELVRGQEIAVRPTMSLVVGTVVVTSTPPAKIYLDRTAGDARGPVATGSPARLTLPPGRHTLELEAADHVARRIDVDVPANGTIEVPVVLDARPPPQGTVVLAANVPGALVIVDGTERGFTPAVLTLPVGRHRLEVRAADYQGWAREVDVVVEGRDYIEVTLTEAEAQVTGATRTAQAVGDAPASITLVPREELWAFGYARLTDAVRAVRGAYVSDDLNYESIGVRGFSRPGDYTNRVLIARDGHPLNDNWIGSTAVGRDLTTDLDDVERIEVIRGPGSTFYGAGAVFGVINLVTRAADEGAAVRAGGRVDSSGGGSAYARGQQALGPVAVAAKAGVYRSRGLDHEFSEFRDTPSRGIVRGGAGEDAVQGALRGRWGDVEFDGAITRRGKDIPTASFETVFDPRRNDATGGVRERTIDQRAYAELRWARRFGDADVLVRGAVDRQRYDGTFPYDDGVDAFVLSDFGEGLWWTGEARATLPLPGQRLTLGGELVRHRVEQGYDEDDDGTPEFDDVRRFNNASAYLVDEIGLGDRGALSIGARLDRFGTQADTAVSPRLGLVLRPYAHGRTKVVAGRAFRSPSVYELFYNDGGLTQLSPEALDPETVWSGELEHTHALGARRELIVSAFASQIRGLIDLAELDDGLVQFGNTSGRVRSLGAELEGRYTWPGKAWLSAALSATALDVDDPALEVNSAALVGQLRGFWPLDGDRLALAGELIADGGRRRRDGELTRPAVDAALFLSGRLGTKGLRYRGGVTNLFDQARVTPGGPELVPQALPQPPRTFVVELVWEPA